ncbi:hypothetical protein CXG81DRAFT_870, partial [Caulochytrium protostelioides]
PAERELLILYASETGTAADVAARLARQARRHRLRPHVAALDAFDKSRLPDAGLALFVIATCGMGDAPANMRRFWQFLMRRALPADALRGLAYGVFGLGDSSYPHFNYAAKRLHKRLAQLGAHAVVDRGDGDDQHFLGLDGALGPWQTAFWQAAVRRAHVPVRDILPDTVVLPPVVAVQLDSTRDAPPPSSPTDSASVPPPPPPPIPDDGVSPSSPAAACGPGTVWATLTHNTRITPASHFQDTRLLTLALPTDAPAHLPGDVLVVQPENPAARVDAFLALCGWTDLADQPVALVPEPGLAAGARANPFGVPPLVPAVLASPSARTLRGLCRFLDFDGRPPRYFFQLLASFATDEMHREKLAEFASPEGQDELQIYCYRLRRTAAEVLADFPSVRVPLAYAVELFGIIRPRHFSIASAPHPPMPLAPATATAQDPRYRTLDLLVAIVHYRTRLSVPREGVCTRWLAALEPGARLQAAVLRGTLAIRPPTARRVVLIGTGTGLAPLRGFVQALTVGAAGQPDRHTASTPPMKPPVLLHGGRNRAADAYDAAAFATLADRGALVYWTAHSRDGADDAPKVYVQHVIEQKAAAMWEYLETDQACVMLCGSAGQMPRDVRAALVQVVVVAGGRTPDDAEAYIAEMERTKRLQQECW